MNMQPLFIEFTGTPEAGKTTTIRMLQERLSSKGFKVEIIRESAEIVPSEIPKTSFDYTRYGRLLTLSKIIQAKYSTSDIILIDRGYWDGQFFGYKSFSDGQCTSTELCNFLKLFSDISMAPHLLIAYFCTPQVALKRRGGPGHIVTKDFVINYNSLMKNFLKTHVTTPFTCIDTSHLEIEDVVLYTENAISICFANRVHKTAK